MNLGGDNMHKKGFIALMLSFTLAASALPVTATEHTDMLGNTEWIVADDIEDVSKALSENLNATYFEEAVIDVMKKKCICGWSGCKLGNYLWRRLQQ